MKPVSKKTLGNVFVKGEGREETCELKEELFVILSFLSTSLCHNNYNITYLFLPFFLSFFIAKRGECIYDNYTV